MTWRGYNDISKDSPSKAFRVEVEHHVEEPPS